MESETTYSKLLENIEAFSNIPNPYLQENKATRESLKEQIRNALANKFSFTHEYVKIVNIKKSVVDKVTAKHCVYVDGKYIGIVYVDQYGGIYGTPAEVKEKLGDNVVFLSGNITRYIEFRYFKEMDKLIAASQTVQFRGIIDDDEDLVLDKNSAGYKALMCINDMDYYIINRDLKWVSTCDPIWRDITSWGFNEKPVGLMEAAKEMWHLKSGIVNVGGNSYIALDNLSNLQRFCKYKASQRPQNGKIQNKIDELVAMTTLPSEAIVDRMPHEYNRLCSKTVINRLSDNLVVIRWVNNYQNETFDGLRVYIEGKDVYACKKNNDGRFIRINLSALNQKNFTSEYSSEIIMDDMTGTRLQYYASVINTIPKHLQMTMLILFLVDPKIEQIVKMGMGEAVCAMMEESNKNILNTIQDTVLANKDGKNIYQWFGINKYQFNKITEFCNSVNHRKHIIMMIGYMKQLFFGGHDMLNEDNGIFDTTLAAYSKFYKANIPKYGIGQIDMFSMFSAIAPKSVMEFVKYQSQNDTTGTLEKNLTRYMPQLFTIIEYGRKYKWNLYTDYVNMVMKMGVRNKVKLYPETYDELKQFHDDTAVAYNLYKDTYQHELFVNSLTKVEKLEYENKESEFCVVIPKGPEDLVVEGIQLRHCVKSYIDKVAEGKTNIVFIRHKDDPSTPFFTVEVTNNREISQVHGLANRNANTEPGMIEFVNQWARNKRLKVAAIDHVA